MDIEHLFRRQSLVNKQQQIVGYELRMNSGTKLHGDGNQIVALCNALSQNEIRLPNDKLFFIDVPIELDIELLIKLSRQIILDVPSATVMNEKGQLFLSGIKSLGFTICLDDFVPNTEATKLLGLASYVKLNARELGLERVVKISAELKKYPIKQIIKRVETEELFRACAKMGADFVQGEYFIRPMISGKRVVSPAVTNILNLMKMAQSDAPVAKMEEILKTDAALSYKLLHYINSAGFGLACEITSYKHAVTILGYKKLYKWLSLLMVTAGKDTTAPVLMKTAAIRGRLAESLGRQYLQDNDCDNLFLTGLFSLLDVIFHMPMEEVLSHIHLSKDLNDALIERGGMYGPFIDLVEATEHNDIEKLEQVAENLQLSPPVINTSHLAALNWVEGMGI